MTKKKTRLRPGKAAREWFSKCNIYSDRCADWSYMERMSGIARLVVRGFLRRMP